MYPNNEISNDDFQILHCLKKSKQRISKSRNFKSRHFKLMDFKFKFKSKCCHPNTTLLFFIICINLQPKRINSSLWNANDWATRGGLVKTDWTQAPFTANECVWSSGASSCSSNSSSSTSTSNAWPSQELDSTSQERLNGFRTQNNYMKYNYCRLKEIPPRLPSRMHRVLEKKHSFYFSFRSILSIFFWTFPFD